MRIAIYFTLLAVAAGVAIWRGSPVERALGATLIAGNLGTLAIVHAASYEDFSSVLRYYFWIDGFFAVLLCGVAVRWPTWASIVIAAFQINGLLGHLVKILSPDTFWLSYALLLKIWGWAMVIVLLLSRYRPTLRRPLKSARWPFSSRARDGRTTATG